MSAVKPWIRRAPNLVRNFGRAPAILTLAVLALCACGTEHPHQAAGLRISGRLYYQGSVQQYLKQPSLGVFAFATPPLQMGIPHASLIILDPAVPAEGIPYQLENLPPYNYTVFAAFLDMDDPQAMPLALGAYPNVCAMLASAVLIEVTEQMPVEDIDVHVYDNMGFDDPCFGGG